MFAVIDNCKSSPCKHGQCKNAVASYKCHCDLGWTGTNCDTSNQSLTARNK